MPKIIHTTVYTIDELPEAGKAKARDWYRIEGMHDDWYNDVFEDFEQICPLLGIEIKRGAEYVREHLSEKAQLARSEIFFRGFSSQGDGASFSATYRYATGAGKAVRAHAPKEKKLHEIADTLQELQKRNFYQLEANVQQTGGTYVHEYTMRIDVDRGGDSVQEPTEDAREVLTEAMREVARWLYDTLRADYDMRTSDDEVDEVLEECGWTFTKSGRQFGPCHH